jgi:MFS family permease
MPKVVLAAPRSLRALDPKLPGSVWLVQSVSLATAVGYGSVLPYSVIYLHDVRGFSLGVAGLVAALLTGMGIASGPITGALVDRLGTRPALLGSLTLAAGALAMFPLVREPWHAFALAAVAGAGYGGIHPTVSSLIAALTAPERRHAAYALQRVSVNAGFGLGGLIGGLVATTEMPGSFTVVFLVAAGSILPAAIATLALPSDPSGATLHLERGRYRDVLRSRLLLRLMLVNTVFVAVGYALLAVVMPVFAKGEAGVTESMLGLIFLANTLFIVIVQLPLARALEGSKRLGVLAGAAACWAVGSMVVLGGGLWFHAVMAAVVIGVAGIVYGIGECLHATVIGPLVADLAPLHMLGRYMGLLTLSFQLGMTVGPAIGGFLLAASPTGLWAGAATLVAVAGLGALALSERIPVHARTTPASPKPSCEPGVTLPV